MGHSNKYWRTNKGLLFWNSRKQLVETFHRLWGIVPEKWVFVRRLFRSKFSYVYYNEFVGVDRFGQRVDWLMWLMLWVPNPSPPWLFPKKIRWLADHEKTPRKDLPRTVPFLLKALRRRSSLGRGKTKALQYCRDFYDYPSHWERFRGYSTVSHSFPRFF